MVKDAETIDKVMPKVLEFVGDSVIVAHNADFDVLEIQCKTIGVIFRQHLLRYVKTCKRFIPRL